MILVRAGRAEHGIWASTLLDPIGLRIVHDFCQAGWSASYTHCSSNGSRSGSHVQVDGESIAGPRARVQLLDDPLPVISAWRSGAPCLGRSTCRGGAQLAGRVRDGIRQAVHLIEVHR